MKDLDMGLDAMERVLKKAKFEGMRHFGHSCMFWFRDLEIRIDMEESKSRQEEHRVEERCSRMISKKVTNKSANFTQGLDYHYTIRIPPWAILKYIISMIAKLQVMYVSTVTMGRRQRTQL